MLVWERRPGSLGYHYVERPAPRGEDWRLPSRASIAFALCALVALTFTFSIRAEHPIPPKAFIANGKVYTPVTDAQTLAILNGKVTMPIGSGR